MMQYKVRLYITKTIFDGVRIPIKKGAYLSILERESLLGSFDFKDGGQFLINEFLSSEQKIKILEILASLVNMYDVSGVKHKSKEKTYKILPTTIVGFAKAYRIDPEGGDCLLGRCVRHATCSQNKKVKDTSCHVVEFDAQPCMLIHHQIRASMKQNQYRTSICFNENTIIACMCDCKAGCEGNGRVICVHVLPIMYQITLLLFKELSHDILVEYANWWRNIHDTDFIEKNKDEIKKAYSF
jgi:hypothetical protein